MYKIGVLPLNGFALMSYASLVEPFRAANFLSEKKYYNVMNFSESKEGTVSSSGLKIVGDYHIGDTPELDIFFGSTILSKSFSLINLVLNASSFKVVPFFRAVFAIFAAWS